MHKQSLRHIENNVWKKFTLGIENDLIDEYGAYFGNNTSFSLFITRFLFNQTVAELHERFEYLGINERTTFTIEDHLRVKFTKINLEYRGELCTVIKAHILITVIENGVESEIGIPRNYVLHDDFLAKSCIDDFEYNAGFFHYYIQNNDHISNKLI